MSHMSGWGTKAHALFRTSTVPGMCGGKSPFAARNAATRERDLVCSRPPSQSPNQIDIGRRRCGPKRLTQRPAVRPQARSPRVCPRR